MRSYQETKHPWAAHPADLETTLDVKCTTKLPTTTTARKSMTAANYTRTKQNNDGYY
jgi:hypothetical protein